MMMMMNDTAIVAMTVTPTHRPDYRAAADRTPWIDLSPRHHRHSLILMDIVIIYYYLHLLIHTKVLYCAMCSIYSSILFLLLFLIRFLTTCIDDSLSNLCVIDYYEDDQFFCNGDHDCGTNDDTPVESIVSYPGGQARNDTYVHFTHTDLVKYGMQQMQQ